MIPGAFGVCAVVLVASVTCLAATTQASSESTVVATSVAATSDDESATSGPDGRDPKRCIVRLHGKGSEGSEGYVAEDGVVNLQPTGNADGWGARQWLYFPDEEYDAARTIVADAAEDCDEVIVNGFSNGAAFAAKLYCRGESLDGRLVRVVVDDPVPDAGVEDCEPDPGVGVNLYWTGALEETAQPGWDCSEADWTCEGGQTIGIEAYADALGTEALPSPFTEHEWFVDAPETRAWRA
jgi:pimeloyl-ACP methyl ester carboxylesterase